MLSPPRLSLFAASATTDAAIVTRAEFIRALKRECRTRSTQIRKAGVGPVDMQQSVIGPGMGVFHPLRQGAGGRRQRHDREDCALADQPRLGGDRERARRQFRPRDAGRARLVRDLRLRRQPSGELITLANAKNIPLDALFASGVFQDCKGKAGLHLAR